MGCEPSSVEHTPSKDLLHQSTIWQPTQSRMMQSRTNLIRTKNQDLSNN